LRDYKKLAEKGKFKQILTANFGEYKVFQSPHISHMDFPHQQLMFPFLLPTPCVIDRPPESLSANIKHVASWSEAESQEGLSPHWKEEIEAAEKSSTNFCAVVVLWWQRDPPRGNEPDLFGALLLSAAERGKREFSCD